MYRIFFKILFPGTLLFLVATILFVVSMRSPKLSKRKRRFEMLFYAFLAIAGLIYSGYNSVDLIKQDFVTESGTYIEDYREGERHKLVFEAADGDRFHCYILFGELNEIDIFHNQHYAATYARRTQMLISIEGLPQSK